MQSQLCPILFGCVGTKNSVEFVYIHPIVLLLTEIKDSIVKGNQFAFKFISTLLPW